MGGNADAVRHPQARGRQRGYPGPYRRAGLHRPLDVLRHIGGAAGHRLRVRLPVHRRRARLGIRVLRHGGSSVPYVSEHHLCPVIVLAAYRYRVVHHHGVRSDSRRHGLVPGRDDRCLLPRGIPDVPVHVRHQCVARNARGLLRQPVRLVCGRDAADHVRHDRGRPVRPPATDQPQSAGCQAGCRERPAQRRGRARARAPLPHRAAHSRAFRS